MSFWSLLASGLGAGRIPWAPGTCGTLAAVPVAWVLTQLPPPLHLIVLGLLLPLAAAVCGRAAREEAQNDPPWIVLDEMVGYWTAVVLVPPSPAAWAAGFVCFRVFDILKPPPIRWIDRHTRGGWGILLDDVAAGLAARAVLAVLLRWGVI